MMSVPGHSPPNRAYVVRSPMNGIARMMAWVIRSPVPDSRSSGSE